MLQLLLVALLGGFAISTIVTDDSSGEGDTSDENDDTPDENGEGGEDVLSLMLNGEELTGADGTDVTGTEAADEFTSHRDESGHVEGADVGLVSGAGGDDYIDISRVTVEGVNGGDGDDVIFAFDGFDIAEGSEDAVYGGAGDDVIYNDYYEDDTELYGGEGNDIMQGGFGRVYGEDGDDTLIGTSLDGGDGNDVLFTYTTIHGGGSATGGAGDDFIHIGVPYEHDIGSPIVSGGEGSDIFHIDADNIFSSAGAPQILDYDRSEDVIQIELPEASIDDPYSGSGQYEYSGVTVTNTAEGSTVTVTYTHNDPDVMIDEQPETLTTNFFVTGVTDLTVDELVLSFDDDFVDAPEQPSLRYLLEDAGYVPAA